MTYDKKKPEEISEEELDDVTGGAFRTLSPTSTLTGSELSSPTIKQGTTSVKVEVEETKTLDGMHVDPVIH